ncbi:MAG TPA: substrate-binding domain-containing protein [Pirellulales bacterium]|nr:substrate-binding domain-containing protein [Pirellulales bacterium]
MMMSSGGNLKNRVKAARVARGWSQDVLAQRAGLSRSGVSAIEIERLVPSAAAALALAKALDCRVEDLFSLETFDTSETVWASPPAGDRCRYWQAECGGRQVLYPAATLADVTIAHDGIFDGGNLRTAPRHDAERTLVMACCDPAVGLLAQELAERAQVRLLVIPRSSGQALEMLRDGLVHVAGLHLSHAEREGNADAVTERLGPGGSYALLRAARWEEGLAVAPARHLRSVRSALAARLRWIGREPGSGAHQCLAEIRDGHQAPRHFARSHRGVAETISTGLADAGVCLRLVSDQAGLDFLSVREEAYDLCFAAGNAHDPRLRALIEVIRSPRYQKLISELPGYSAIDMGDLRTVGSG